MAKRVNEGYFKEHYAITEKDVVFYSVKQPPFSIHGLYEPETKGDFRRLPDRVAIDTSDGVAGLYRNTAGGRIRFVTDSEYLAVQVEMPYIANRSIMPLLCTAGFDIYLRKNGRERYRGSFRPPVDMTDGFESCFHFGNRDEKEITLYMPLYNDISRLTLGLSKDAKLSAHPGYAVSKPVVYYGSSIPQGAAASRPGMSYEGIISRRLNGDFINLGFAGNAKGEDAIVRYIADLDFCAFVCDYDHNAPTAQYLQNTHEKLYKTIRAAHKVEPILLVTRPNPYYSNQNLIQRRNIVYSTYLHGIQSGDKNLYFVDGFALLGSEDTEDCFADGTHPNDLGFYRMAGGIGSVLELALENINE